MDKNVEICIEKGQHITGGDTIIRSSVMNKSVIPNLFTSSNLAFGVISITLFALRQYHWSWLFA